MALYQFTALDAGGNEKRGKIEAVSQQAAYAAIQSHGLQPTNVAVATQPVDASAASPSLPRAGSRSGLAVINCILSVLAIILALTALMWQFFRSHPNPLGKGLEAYDFSTPKDALMSRLKIDVNVDFLAQIELARKLAAPELEEKLRTLTVSKDETWKDMKILFVSYEINKQKQYRTFGFKKDEKSGLWLPESVPEFEIKKQDPLLAKRLTDWRSTGKLD